MKKLTLAFLALISFVCASAQNFSAPYYEIGKLYVGYVILTDGTKIDGYIQALPPASEDLLAATNQTKVIYYQDPRNKKSKKVYEPKDLTGYKIDDKEYRTLDYGDMIGPKKNFVLLLRDGQIQTYQWYIYTEEHGLESRWVFRKGEDKPLSQTNFILNFSKKMSDYVSDYADLATKITTKVKGYDLLHIEAIIAEYNEWFAAQKK